MAHMIEELEMKIEAHVHVSTDKVFTTTAVEVRQGRSAWTGIGTAKRNVTDPYNEDVGITLATSRAFRDLADDLEGQAHKMDGTHGK